MTSGWRRVLVAVVILSAAWATPSAAQPPRGGPMRPGGWMDGLGMTLPAILRGVNLTSDQEAQVRQILASHRPTFQALWQQLRTAQESMADRLFGAAAVQSTDFAPSLQQVAQVREQLAQESLKVALEIRAVLTADQLTRAAQIKDRLRALRSEERALFEGKP